MWVAAYAESPPVEAGAGDAAASLPDDPLSLDFEVSDEEPLSLDEDDESDDDSLLSEFSAGRFGRP